MMAEQLIRMAVNLLVGVLIARHLGPTDFGKLSYAMALTSLLAIIGTLGLNRIGVRELVECGTDAARRLQLMSTLLAMRTLASAVLLLVCLSLALLLGQGDPVVVAVLALTLLFRPADVAELFFQSQSQIKNITKARTATFLIVTGLRLVLLKLDAGRCGPDLGLPPRQHALQLGPGSAFIDAATAA